MSADLYQQAYRAHHRAIWGLCYRMTGSAADADDLVQDTFARAIERPPKRMGDPLQPWLVRVAMNLSRDLLRKRKRQSYVGPWLPGVIETTDGPPPCVEATLPDGDTTEARYDLMESVSIAFLLALEALTPTKRAVLLLRDVFSYSVKEAARALGLSEANVKTTLHRARKEMEAYDQKKQKRRKATDREAHLEALGKFFALLSSGDVPGLEALLAEDVRADSDGGGEYFSAKIVVTGRKRVITFFSKLAARRGVTWYEFRELNGLPGVLMAFAQLGPGEAPRAAFSVELDGEGRIAELHSFLATDKLRGVRFPE